MFEGSFGLKGSFVFNIRLFPILFAWIGSIRLSKGATGSRYRLVSIVSPGFQGVTRF